MSSHLPSSPEAGWQTVLPTDEWLKMVEESKRLREENEHLRAVLIATQRALREMQAQRDRAREGKR